MLEEGHPLRCLVAITFTDKAAREMRSRIRELVSDELQALSEIADQAPAPGPLPHAVPDPAYWRELLAGLEGARIGTIHSFCAELLRAQPAEAGIDPGFAVLEENAAAVLRTRALEAALAWAAGDPDASALFEALSEYRLRETVRTLLDRRLDAEAAFRALADDPLPAWGRALGQWLADALDTPAWREPLVVLAGVECERESDRMEQARRAVLAAWAEVQAARRAGAWDTCLEALGNLRAAIVSGGAKTNWAAEELAAAREAMAALRDHFDCHLALLADRRKPARWDLDRQAAGLLPLLQATYRRALAEYDRAREERSALDFDDLEAMAAGLLTGDAAVRARWQGQIEGVLVDEFQDTNARQRQIVYALSGFQAPPGSGAGPASSSLFVVGDAKQSIYRFRGADVAVFRQVQADVAAAGGRQVNLDLTFRAHEPLVETLNALLAPILGSEAEAGQPFQVPFAPLRADRQAPRPGSSGPFVEFHLGLGDNADEGRQVASRALAARLHELHDGGGLAWGDVALLFRASTAFPYYEDALEAAGIPFVTVAGRGFYERPEVRDLLNALAALADPWDDAALAGLLRSPAVGLTDAALYRLRFGPDGRRRGLWAALQAAPLELDPAGEERAALALNLIRDVASLAGRVPVGRLLKRLLDTTGFRAALALSGGERLLRNVDKLVDDAYLSGLVSVSEFLEYVRTLRDVGARESEAPTSAEGAVQLMTVHKAKGLEFPLVVIADAARSEPSGTAPVAVESDWGVLLDLRDGDARSVMYRLAAERQAEMEEAESRRLLYVAATRARERLIVSGHAKVSTAKSDPGRLLLGGWLRWLGEGTGLDQVRLEGLPAAPRRLDLDWGGPPLACTCYPLDAGPPALRTNSAEVVKGAAPTLQDMELLAPLAPPPPAGIADEKSLDRESDPPPRVWRVVPRTRSPRGPAWVVGTLVHAALQRWRFPDQPDFEVFLHPHALEAGLTDPGEISNAVSTARRLLERFCRHDLWAEMDAAERYHELPYVRGQERGIVDLLYRHDGGWTVAEFKTDRLADAAAMEAQIEREGYRQT
ncbi:MAG: UvrD-helicase domain-containing protein [Anaerolineae bacterium]